MNSRILSFAMLLLLWLPGSSASAAEACAPDGAVQFVCGVESAEDLIAVPGTPWVIASGRIADDDGFLYGVDTRDHSSTVLYPGGTSSFAPNFTLYRTCPGAPAPSFQPHGVALREGQGSQHTLYVVGHGEREAVEVFTLDASGAVPSLTWIGCVIAPEGVSLNSVTSLPGNGGPIVVTNFVVAGGELWEWSASAGWSEVPGSESAGPNGVVSSPDGNWLYVGGWGSESLIRLSRGRMPVETESAPVGFHIDNVRWAPDGTLLVAGQYNAPGSNIGACLRSGGSCEGIASRAAKVDPVTLEVEQLVDYPSNDLLKFGTVAIQVDDEIWVGGIAGATRIGRFAVRQ
ncbi:MAG: hypothetical protein WD772_06175 [Pseudohongiellaceae bacterium]